MDIENVGIIAQAPLSLADLCEAPEWQAYARITANTNKCLIRSLLGNCYTPLNCSTKKYLIGNLQC